MNRARLFRAILAAFLAVWFGAIVPGHRRGIVQLPEARCECAECCSKAPGDKTPAAPGHCAICYFALTLANPPIVVPELTRLNLVERLAPPPALRSASIHFPAPYFERGPPTSIA